ISAVFRRGGDVSFVVEELKAVFDPRGGQWMGGRYVPSLLAAIGEGIERHMVDIGFRAPTGRTPHGDPALERPLLASVAAGEASGADISPMPQGAGSGTASAAASAGPRVSPFLRQCPKCGSPSLIRQEGCDTCTSCDY